jgi:hypothetical protein
LGEQGTVIESWKMGGGGKVERGDKSGAEYPQCLGILTIISANQNHVIA